MATKVAVRILPDQPKYWPNQSVSLYAEFRDVESNELTDPADVELKIVTGSGIELSYTYGAAEVSTQGTGLYSKEIEIGEPYTWKFKWQGTGGASSSAAGLIEIGVDVDPTGTAPTFPDPGVGDDGKIARAASGVWTPYGSTSVRGYLRGNGTGGWQEATAEIGDSGPFEVVPVRVFARDSVFNDASPSGQTLTNGVDGALIIDGVTMAVGELVGTAYKWTEATYPIGTVTATGDVDTPWAISFAAPGLPSFIIAEEGDSLAGVPFVWAGSPTTSVARLALVEDARVVFSDGSGGGVVSPNTNEQSASLELPGNPFIAGYGYAITSVFVFAPAGAGFFDLTARLEASLNGGTDWDQVGIASFVQTVADATGPAIYQVTVMGRVPALENAALILLRGRLTSAAGSDDDVNWTNLFLHASLGRLVTI